MRLGTCLPMTETPADELMPAGRPAAEVDIDATLVHHLLEEQYPDLAHLPLSHLDSGWDNVMYRLGEAYTVRLPRREIAAQLLINEQEWLPTLAARLPIPVPAPLRTGEPDAGYPWRWSVLPWFAGDCADVRMPASREADRFARFLLALHQPAPDKAPTNPVRGVPLRVRQANTEERMSRVRQKTELLTREVLATWETALAAAEQTESCWLHGDLHAQNVLIKDDGSFAAIIDWGDITAGDVATDLAGIWALFERSEDRQEILERYQPDEPTLARARGWAVIFGVILVDSGLINSPRHAAAGGKILQRLAAG